jgi:anti-sigma regulatory factor (Ser/Thr protein kinase)
VTTQPAQRRGFRHEAFFYAGEDEFLAGALPFLEAGIAAGEVVLAVLPEPRRRLLREALGPAAAAVEFQSMEEVGRNPGRLIAGWRDVLRRKDPGRAVRGLGEPAYAGRSADELDECERHERLVNLAFKEERGLAFMCPYDTTALDDDVLAGAARSHPHCLDSEGVSVSPRFAVGFPLEGTLTKPEAPTVALGFGKSDLGTVRQAVGDLARSVGLDQRRNEDLVLAVCEAATNSIQHATGGGCLTIWRDGDDLVCEIHDFGRIENPLVGRERPPVEQVGGRGIRIANQLCDLVQLRSDEDGTYVRLRMAID